MDKKELAFAYQIILEIISQKEFDDFAFSERNKKYNNEPYVAVLLDFIYLKLFEHHIEEEGSS